MIELCAYGDCADGGVRGDLADPVAVREEQVSSRITRHPARIGEARRAPLPIDVAQDVGSLRNAREGRYSTVRSDLPDRPRHSVAHIHIARRIDRDSAQGHETRGRSGTVGGPRDPHRTGDRRHLAAHSCSADRQVSAVGNVQIPEPVHRDTRRALELCNPQGSVLRSTAAGRARERRDVELPKRLHRAQCGEEQREESPSHRDLRLRVRV